MGYTNAGKSTLLNWFSKSEVLVENRLFATLDSTVRLVNLSPVHRILLSDTVGFIRKLPHHLVASFKSTLDEVTESDLLLHVVDVSHPHFEEQITVVHETLDELIAEPKPTIMVFNKVDRLPNRNIISHLGDTYADAVFISAFRSINMKSLEERIINILNRHISEQTITLRQDEYPIISQIHEIAEVLDKQYEGDAITIRFRMNKIHAERLKKTLAKKHSN